MASLDPSVFGLWVNETMLNGIKTFYLLLLLIFLWSEIGTAEFRRSSRSIRKGEVSLPLYAGFSFPNPQFGGQGGSVDGRTGVAFGTGMAVAASTGVELSMEFLYVDKGYRLSQGETLTVYNIGFVEMPIQIRLYPLENFFFHAGPYYALVVSGTREENGQRDSVKGQLRNDFGMTIGAFFGFKSKGTLKIGLNLRYDIGFADIDHDNDPRDSIQTRSIITLATMMASF